MYNTPNSDGTIRTTGNDDTSPYWYPGKLYDMYPHKTNNSQTISTNTYTPPALPSYPSTGSYGGYCSTSNGGSSSEFHGGTCVVVLLCGGLFVMIMNSLVNNTVPRSSGYQSQDGGTQYRQTAVAKVAANVRSQPRRQSRKIGSLPKGKTVQILQSGTWDRVLLSDGRQGYVYDGLIRKQGSAPAW